MIRLRKKMVFILSIVFGTYFFFLASEYLHSFEGSHLKDVLQSRTEEDFGESLNGRAPTPDGLRDSGLKNPERYYLSYADEFSDNSSLAAWHTKLRSSGGNAGAITGDLQWYTDDMSSHQFVDGKVSLIARRERVAGFSEMSGEKQEYEFSSGMLRSKVSQRYGYFEARVRVPLVKGVEPAFWLAPADGEWPPEINVFSIFQESREDKLGCHFPLIQGFGALAETLLDFSPEYFAKHDIFELSKEFAQSFHTFAMEWTADRVSHFIDGKMIVSRRFLWQDSNGKEAAPAQIIFSLGVGGFRSFEGPDGGFKQASMEIDYVRIYSDEVKRKVAFNVK